jgi:spore germination protein YaaH
VRRRRHTPAPETLVPPRRSPRAAATRALLALAGALAAVPSAARAQAAERLFYYVDQENSYDSFVRNVDQITVVGPQVYTMDSLGIVFGQMDVRVLKLAKERGVKVMPLFVNEGFQQPGLRRFLADSAARARSVRTLVELCRAHGYWGIQFDVENVNVEDRDRFTAWYTDAANALHKAGYKISIAVVHRTDDTPGPLGYHRFLYDSWRGAFDLARLGRASDFVSVMSYDQHTGRTPPGPIAGLPWARAVVDYFLRFIPPEKLSLGIPLYGKHWFAGYDGSAPGRVASAAEYVSWAWGAGLAERNGAAVRWDSTQAVPFASYSNGGTWEWLFLEDVRSFEAKLALAKEKRLRGFSAWALGTEDARIWETLRRTAADVNDRR